MSALISPMYDWRGRPPRRHDDITISAIRVAFVLSLLLHAAALVTLLPHLKLLTPSDAVDGDVGSPLAVKLETKVAGAPGSMPQSPPPAPEPVVPKRAPERSPPPATASLRPPSRTPAMTTPQRTPDAPALPVTPQPTPAPPQATGVPDLAAYIEARRRERGEQAQPEASNPPAPEDDNDRKNRIIAANIGTNVRPSFGRDPKNGGGVFQIKTLEYSYAEFYFFGWNKDISRNSKQVIEVRKGDNPDIRLAVVRKMIGIVREHETGDFLWESNRLGRQLTLSARQKDTAELESFLMKEFNFDTASNAR